MRVIVDGVVVADSTRAYRILETSHPPGWYLPPEDVRLDLLERTRRQTACEFMGEATFFRLRDSGTREVDVAWTYPRPLPGYEAVAGYVSFYPGRVDEAWVDDERAAAQPGDFYGGWITSDVADPSTSSGPGTPGR